MNLVRCALLLILGVQLGAAEGEAFISTPLGDTGVLVDLPVGAVTSPENGETNPDRTGGPVYGFHLRIDDNYAQEPLKIIVGLAAPYFSGADAQRSFMSYKSEDERIYSNLWTWSASGNGFHMYVMKDRGLKIIRKRFYDPARPADSPIRELWISYPLTQVAKGDKILRRIESTFRPFPK